MRTQAATRMQLVCTVQLCKCRTSLLAPAQPSTVTALSDSYRPGAEAHTVGATLFNEVITSS